MNASKAKKRTTWFQCSGWGWGLGVGGWRGGALRSPVDCENALIARNGDAGDAGQGLGEAFGSAGQGGERGQRAQLGQERRGVTRPRIICVEEGVEGVAERV